MSCWNADFDIFNQFIRVPSASVQINLVVHRFFTPNSVFSPCRSVLLLTQFFLLLFTTLLNGVLWFNYDSVYIILLSPFFGKKKASIILFCLFVHREICIFSIQLEEPPLDMKRAVHSKIVSDQWNSGELHCFVPKIVICINPCRCYFDIKHYVLTDSCVHGKLSASSNDIVVVSFEASGFDNLNFLSIITNFKGDP